MVVPAAAIRQVRRLVLLLALAGGVWLLGLVLQAAAAHAAARDTFASLTVTDRAPLPVPRAAGASLAPVTVRLSAGRSPSPSLGLPTIRLAVSAGSAAETPQPPQPPTPAASRPGGRSTSASPASRLPVTRAETRPAAAAEAGPARPQLPRVAPATSPRPEVSLAATAGGLQIGVHPASRPDATRPSSAGAHTRSELFDTAAAVAVEAVSPAGQDWLAPQLNFAVVRRSGDRTTGAEAGRDRAEHPPSSPD